jgi:predicted AAA+ superfamily ATPase
VSITIFQYLQIYSHRPLFLGNICYFLFHTLLFSISYRWFRLLTRLHAPSLFFLFFQASYIIFLLEPYYKNIKKRLIKSPKLYFFDTGIASFLMGMENESHVASHPQRGSLFENLVTAELLKMRFNRSRRHNLNFFRDRKGNEVDLVYHDGHQVIAIEIKSAETVNSDLFRGLHYFENLFPDLTKKKILVYGGTRNEYREDVDIGGIWDLGKLIPMDGS